MFTYYYFILIFVNHNVYNILFICTGGVKMRYPSCYVLVTDLDDSTAELHKNNNNLQTTPQQQQPSQNPPLQQHSQQQSM